MANICFPSLERVNDNRSRKLMSTMDAEGAGENLESSDNNRDANNEQGEGAIGFSHPPANTSTSTREDNPFSFRHFLRRSQNIGPVTQPDQHRISEEEFEANRCGGARPKTKTRNSRIGLDSADVKSPCGLPDFVQDYMGVEHDLNGQASYLNGFHMPDQNFGSNNISADSPLDLPRSHSPIHAAGAMPIPLDIANLASSHIEDDVHLGTLDLANLNSSAILNDLQPHEEPAIPGAAQAHEINNNENVNSLTQLPDFLSDGPMQSSRMNQETIEDGSPGIQLPPHNGVVLEENARLRQQLEMTITNERMALARIERLETLLEEHRQRESEEASSLERSMEQIESNLKIATQRAVQSESQVTQLKKENRRLQDEVKSLQEAIRLQYNEETSPSQARSLNHTAQELHTAANSAERSIRDLLAGVEHLRVVAATLQSMERIEEVRTKRDRDK